MSITSRDIQAIAEAVFRRIEAGGIIGTPCVRCGPQQERQTLCRNQRKTMTELSASTEEPLSVGVREKDAELLRQWEAKGKPRKGKKSLSNSLPETPQR